MRRNGRAWTGLLMATAAFTGAGYAATPINISGTVINPPSCVVNDNKTIVVDFGNDLLTTKVDGNTYMRTLEYTLSCNSSSSNAVKMQIQGTVSAFNNSALQVVEHADLGIALRVNGQPLPINSWLNFTYSQAQRPLLQAVPIKRPGGTLGAGSFGVGATMVVAYQ